MSTQAVFAGDVEIIRLQLTTFTNDKPLDLLPQFAEIEIYQSLEEQFMYGSLEVADAVGMFNNYPLVGEELLTFEFKVPGGDRTTEAKFFVFSAESISKTDSQLKSIYRLKFTSVEKKYALISSVPNAYNEPIASIVPKIVSDYLYSKKRITIEPTLGSQQLVFPSSSPSAALDMCARRAISPNFKSSSYVFYEDFDGFVFKTIEKVINDSRKRPIDQYHMTPTKFRHGDGTNKITTGGNPSSRSFDFFTLTSYNVHQRYNTLSKISQGIVSSELVEYDLITKTETKTKYKYSDTFSQTRSVDGSGSGKTLTDEYVGRIDNLRNTKDSMVKGYMVKDSSKPNTYFDRSFGHRLMYMNSLNQHDVSIVVPGRTQINPGMLVHIKVPAMEGATSENTEDQYLSGNFLAYNVKHLVARANKRITYSCTIDLAKDSYLNNISTQGNFQI